MSRQVTQEIEFMHPNETAPKRLPSAEEITKKLKLSFGLFEAAFAIKRHQLQKKYPQKTSVELNHMTMALFEAGAR